MTRCNQLKGTCGAQTRESCDENEIHFLCCLCTYKSESCGSPYCHSYCNGSCKQYKSGEVCGCKTYSGWSGWSGYTLQSCSAGSYRECSGATFYK